MGKSGTIRSNCCILCYCNGVEERGSYYKGVCFWVGIGAFFRIFLHKMSPHSKTTPNDVAITSHVCNHVLTRLNIVLYRHLTSIALLNPDCEFDIDLFCF